MRARQSLRPCVMLLVACPLTAAVAQPRCDTLPAFQREFARATGACRDLAPIIDIAPPTVETTPSPAPPVPTGSTEAMQPTASPGSSQAKKITPQRTEARKSSSNAATASTKSTAPKTAASRKSEGERRNEPFDASGWKTYQDDRYTFKYPAGLMTILDRNGGVELHSPDREFRMRASSRINSEKRTVESAWQQRLKEHGRSVTYKKKGDGWFVVSGVEGGKTYYRKQFVSPERMAELVITYPKSRASVYDPWVSEIEKSFVAYRVSDTAQASSSTEPPSAVTTAPAVNETRELPNVTGRSYADAANGLTEFKVERVEVASAAPTGEVLAQDPAPGSSVRPGSPITLRVSDGSLVTAAATVPAPSAASVASASQLEPSTPVQNDRVAGAFIGGIASNVVAALVAGVLLGLLLGAVLMRRTLLARSRSIDTTPAEPLDIAPVEIDRSHAVAEVHRVAAIKPPAEIKFTARLDPGETTIKFADLVEEEEAAIAYSRNQYAE